MAAFVSRRRWVPRLPSPDDELLPKWWKAGGLLLGGIVLLGILVAGALALIRSQRSEPAAATAAPVERGAGGVDLFDQAALEGETRRALTCLRRFFATDQEILRLAQLRPGPELAQRYAAARAEIERLCQATPMPGGALKRRPPFLGIPLHLQGQERRIAWIEVRGETARLDLDSLVAAGSKPWSELAGCAPGQRVVLRGRLEKAPTAEEPGVFTSADGQRRLKIEGMLEPAPELRLELERLPESAFRRADWRVTGVLGRDWLEAPASPPPAGS